MRIPRVWVTAVLMVVPAASPAADSGRPRPPSLFQGAPVHLDGKYGNLPLAFEPNTGQTAPEVRFVARGGGMTAFFTDAETVMVLGRSEQAVVRMKLAGATKPRQTVGLEKLPGVSNYFIGNDPKKWRTDVPHYSRIQYEGVYRGIDLVWYGNQRQLEYDFVVGPGADPKQIQVAYQGVESVEVEAGGELVLRTALGEVRQQAPRVYQEIGGKRVEVGARYALVARNRVRFELAQYDRKRALRIDPVVLVYSTYLGGSGDDWATGIAVDGAGSAYITGTTYSPNFPTQSAYLATYQGGSNEAFVTKLTPAGDALVYSTYLGGSDQEYGFGIAVDAAGSAYVTGQTYSTNFPTQSAYQTSQGGGDVFVSKLVPAGNALVYSTYLGGSGDDYGYGIAVDAAGSAYLTGLTASTNFPTQSPYQAQPGSDRDAFVTKLSPAGNSLVYSTYLGGSAVDEGHGIAVDGSGSAYVTGLTYSANFPTQSAYQPTLGGVEDVFVSKLAPSGNSLAYSTYLGGNDSDEGLGIAVDAAGSAYVTGQTYSTNFPIQSAYQATSQGYPDAIVTKLSPAGNALSYSTYLGGSSDDVGFGIAVDAAGSAYVTGYTASTDFPTHSPYQAALQGPIDGFVTKLTPTGNALSYSTYLGGSSDDVGFGIAVDAAGSAYVAGETGSTDLPTQSAYQGTFQGGSEDAFVTKLKLEPQGSGTVVATNPPGLAIVVDSVTQTAPQTFNWAPGSSHTLGTTSPQQSGGTRYVFANWSDGGAQNHNITVSSSVTTYTARFTSAYRLTSSVSPPAGGTVSASPTSPDGYYSSGSSVQLTATASPGYRFSGWSGDLTGSANPQLLVMSAPRNATAVFSAGGPLISAVLDSASGRPTIAPNSFTSIYGSSFTSWTGNWSDAIQDGMLPATLGGVEVRIDGKDCFVNYVSSSQLNVLTPFDTASGSVSVEVITAQGTATATAVMAPVAPALFGYTVGEKFYAVAQIPTDGNILVAPVWMFDSARPARAGDYVTLWALGMGGTSPAAPAGRVLETAYPISDLSRVKVRFGSVDATVSWAGMVMAGLFQVNVLVPPGLSGDLPVVTTVDGQSTQAGAFLNFQ